MLDRPGRCRTHRRHYAVAEGCAYGRGLQRAGLSAFPDGTASAALLRRAEQPLARIHSAARPGHEDRDEDRERRSGRIVRTGPWDRLGLVRARQVRCPPPAAPLTSAPLIPTFALSVLQYVTNFGNGALDRGRAMIRRLERKVAADSCRTGHRAR